MEIEELMSSEPATCQATDTLSLAAQLMWQHDCGTIPVIDGDGKPIAMVTDRDICMATLMEGKAPSDLLVATAMSSSVIVCRKTDSVTSAESLMRAQQVRRLPVIDRDGRLAGVLSLNDIATHEHRTKKAGFSRDGLGADAIANTLAAICERKMVADA